MRRIGICVSVLLAGCIHADETTPPGPSRSPDSGIADGGGADASDASQGQDGGGADQGGTSTDAGTTACNPTTPTLVASFEGPVQALAVDATHVFWISPPVSRFPGFYRAPKEGGEVTQIGGVTDFREDGIDAAQSVDGDGLFIVEAGRGGHESPGTVGRFDSRGEYTVLAEGARYPCGWVGHPRRVSTDASRVYWIEQIGYTAIVPDPLDPSCDRNMPNEGARFLRSVSKRGGDARSPVRVPSLGMAVGAEFVYFTEGTTLYRLPKDGGTLQPWVTDLRDLRVGDPLLAMDGDRIYLGGESVYAVDIPRGRVRSIADSSGAGSRVNQFAFDDRYVYWATAGEGGAIRRVPKSGGPSELVMPGGDATVAVDERYLYWGQGGSVWRRCKSYR